MNYSNLYQSINEVMAASTAQVASGEKKIQSPSHMGFKTSGVKTTWQQRGEQGQNRRRQELKNLARGMGVDVLGDTTHRDVRRGVFAAKHRSPDDPGENRDFVPLPPGPDGWWTWPDYPYGYEKPTGRGVYRPPPPEGPGSRPVINPDTGTPEGYPPRPEGKVIPVKPDMVFPPKKDDPGLTPSVITDEPINPTVGQPILIDPRTGKPVRGNPDIVIPPQTGDPLLPPHGPQWTLPAPKGSNPLYRNPWWWLGPLVVSDPRKRRTPSGQPAPKPGRNPRFVRPAPVRAR